jgi:hypothetical protein
MWFTETAWPPVVIVLTAATAAAILWKDRRQSRYLAIVAGCVIAAIAIVAVEEKVVTERERIEQSIHHLATDFEHADADAVVDAISKQSPELRLFARAAVNAVQLSSARVTDVNVEMLSDSRAKSHFRVNGTVALRSQLNGTHQATRWIATWQNEGDRWRILDVSQLDTITGEPTQQFRKLPGGEHLKDDAP